MVKFIQATCPSCGGQLQIPDNLTKAFCSYCGATVILEWEGRPGPGPTVASYMKLGQAAMQANSYKEADKYFSKALELNPDTVQAWVGRALALLENEQPMKLASSYRYLDEKRQMACTYLEKAFSLDPDDVTALIYLGILRNEPEPLEKAASLDNSRQPQIARILLAIARALLAEEINWHSSPTSMGLRGELARQAAKLLETAYRIDPATKKDVAKGMFNLAFDVEHNKRFLGKPYAVLVVHRQDLIDRAVELEPALGNIVNVAQRWEFPYRTVHHYEGDYDEWIQGDPLSNLRKFVGKHLGF